MRKRSSSNLLKENAKSLYLLFQEALLAEDSLQAIKSAIKEARQFCAAFNIKLKLDKNEQFIAEQETPKAQFIADSLNALHLKDYKYELTLFLTEGRAHDVFDPSIQINAETLAKKLVGNARSEETQVFSQHTSENMLYQDKELRRKYLISDIDDQEISWDLFLPEEFSELHYKELFRNALMFHGIQNFKEYNINYMMLEDQSKALAYMQIAGKTLENVELVCKSHHIEVIDMSLRQGQLTKENKQAKMLKVLSVVKQTQKPSFFIVSNNEHWAVIGAIPDPLNTKSLTLTYMNSFNSDTPLGTLGKDYAEELGSFISEHPNLDFSIASEHVKNLSLSQQVGNICGYAAAMNIADQVEFFNNAKENNLPLNWQQFKREPKTLPEVGQTPISIIENEVKTLFGRIDAIVNSKDIKGSISKYKPWFVDLFGYDISGRRKALIKNIIKYYKDAGTIDENIKPYLADLERSLGENKTKQDMALGIFLNMLIDIDENCDLSSVDKSIKSLMAAGEQPYRNKKTSLALDNITTTEEQNLLHRILQELGKEDSIEQVMNRWLEEKHQELGRLKSLENRLAYEEHYSRIFLDIISVIDNVSKYDSDKLPKTLKLNKEVGILLQGELIETICSRIAQNNTKYEPEGYLAGRTEIINALPQYLKNIHEKYIEHSTIQINSLRVLHVFRKNRTIEAISASFLELFQDTSLYNTFKERLDQIVEIKQGEFKWKKPFKEVLEDDCFRKFAYEALDSAYLKEKEYKYYSNMIDTFSPHSSKQDQRNYIDTREGDKNRSIPNVR